MFQIQRVRTQSFLFSCLLKITILLGWLEFVTTLPVRGFQPETRFGHAGAASLREKGIDSSFDDPIVVKTLQVLKHGNQIYIYFLHSLQFHNHRLNKHLFLAKCDER